MKVSQVIHKNYKVYEVDLSVAHTDSEVGLKDSGIIAEELIVIQADSAAYFKLNAPKNDLITAFQNLKIKNFEIREIYVTNSAATGKLKIMLIW
jgi:hypothetical protein